MIFIWYYYRELPVVFLSRKTKRFYSLSLLLSVTHSLDFFFQTSKSASATSKRLSTQCMVSDNDDPTLSNSEFKSTNSQHARSGKPIRTGLFTGSIFTRVSATPRTHTYKRNPIMYLRYSDRRFPWKRKQNHN